MVASVSEEGPLFYVLAKRPLILAFSEFRRLRATFCIYSPGFEGGPRRFLSNRFDKREIGPAFAPL
jgi:hypothetical protein